MGKSWIKKQKEKLFSSNNPLANLGMGDYMDVVAAPFALGYEALNQLSGMTAKGPDVAKIRDKSLEKRRRQVSGLAAQTMDTTLDRETRQDIGGFLQSGDLTNRDQVNSMLNEVAAARAGTSPKYAARIASQHAYDIMVDQPGAKQTRDNGIGSLLMGNQFRGR